MPIIAKTFAQTTKAFDQRIVDKDVFASLMERDRLKIENEIIRRVKLVLEPFLLRNRVIRSLINPVVGMPGYDLAAEFGITDTKARSDAEFIIDTLLNTVTSSTSAKTARVSGLRNVSRFSPGCRYLEPSRYESEISGLGYQAERQFSPNPRKNAKYRAAYVQRYNARIDKKYPGFNRPGPEAISQYNIAYGKWMMNARGGINGMRNDIPSVEFYGIIYDLYPQEVPHSRSGRAIMLDITKPRNIKRVSTFPYEFPAAIKPWPGEKNFVTGLAHNQSLREQVEKTIINVVDRVAGNRR